MAVERSRLEARQARNERRKEAEAQAERVAASARAAAERAQADRARQQQQAYGGHHVPPGYAPRGPYARAQRQGRPGGPPADPWSDFVDGLRGAARDLEREWFGPDSEQHAAQTAQRQQQQGQRGARPQPPQTQPAQPPPPPQAQPSPQGQPHGARYVQPEPDPLASVAAAAQQGLQNLGRSFQSALHDFGHGGSAHASSARRPQPR